MTQDALSVVSFIFTKIWKLFTSFYIPGTDITPATWAMFSLFFVLFIRIIKRLLADGTFDSSSEQNRGN